jgi:hypothetical protein
MCERIYTSEEMKVINKVKQENPRICYYCNKSIPEKDVATIDHKDPVSKGGLTVEENLVIACYKCNQEKDNMTVEEYQIYKQKQQEINNNEVTQFISEMIITYNNSANRQAEIQFQLNEVENKILELQQDIMIGEHNACEGYILNKMLKDLLLEKEKLRTLKLSYNHLNILLGNHRKTLLEVKEKIQNEVNKTNRVYVKRYAISKCKGKRKKSKIVDINKLQIAN